MSGTSTIMPRLSASAKTPSAASPSILASVGSSRWRLSSTREAQCMYPSMAEVEQLHAECQMCRGVTESDHQPDADRHRRPASFVNRLARKVRRRPPSDLQSAHSPQCAECADCLAGSRRRRAEEQRVIKIRVQHGVFSTFSYSRPRVPPTAATTRPCTSRVRGSVS